MPVFPVPPVPPVSQVPSLLCAKPYLIKVPLHLSIPHRGKDSQHVDPLQSYPTWAFPEHRQMDWARDSGRVDENSVSVPFLLLRWDTVTKATCRKSGLFGTLSFRGCLCNHRDMAGNMAADWQTWRWSNNWELAYWSVWGRELTRNGVGFWNLNNPPKWHTSPNKTTSSNPP